jgi:hypothetical protein
MKNIFLRIAVASIILHFVSCDPSTKIKYEIRNNTDKTILVKYDFELKNNNDITLREATIEPNKSKIINEDLKLGFPKQFDETHDSICLYSMTITKGNLTTSINFKDKNYWTFETDGNFKGIYKLTVNQKIFKD